MATSFLKSLFEDNTVMGDRQPLWTFTLPSIFSNGGDSDEEIHRFALFAPSAVGWKQLSVFVIIQSAVQILFACIIYKLIVQQRGTMQAYLVGWGVVLPLSIYLPFYFLDLFDIRNKVVTLSASTLMTVIFFRCLEAMYGTSPEVVESTLWNYCGYYSSVAPFVWNPKTMRRETVTMEKFLSLLGDIVIHFAAVSVVLSILIPYRYKPFDDPVSLTGFTISTDLINPGHLLNSYCHASKCSTREN
jgi:hypothetical protein